MIEKIGHDPFELGPGLKALPTLTNVMRLLEEIGDRICFDEMRGRILCRDIEQHGHLPGGLWSDVHTIALVAVCEAHGLPVSKATVQDAVVLHAKRHALNPLRDWLEQCGLAWDGVERVDRALATYWGAADDAASAAVSRTFFLSLAARGLEPGCKVDTCPIFIGEQGIYKSTALRTLAGGADWFADSPLPIGDKDAMQNIRGKWLWEIGENAGISQRDRNAVKAFLSASHDTFRASYGHFSEDVPRTCVFAVTTNDDEVLHDPTGSRRHMPVRVTRIDLSGIERDREQLLGEAAFRVLEGEQHWPTKEEDAALKRVREDHQETDAWDDAIADWLEPKPADFRFALDDLFLHAVQVDRGRIDKSAQTRAAKALSRLGWERGPQKREDGERVRKWQRKTVTSVTT